jgi:hypothetical protein
MSARRDSPTTSAASAACLARTKGALFPQIGKLLGHAQARSLLAPRPRPGRSIASLLGRVSPHRCLTRLTEPVALQGGGLFFAVEIDESRVDQQTIRDRLELLARASEVTK